MSKILAEILLLPRHGLRIEYVDLDGLPSIQFCPLVLRSGNWVPGRGTCSLTRDQARQVRSAIDEGINLGREAEIDDITSDHGAVSELEAETREENDEP